MAGLTKSFQKAEESYLSSQRKIGRTPKDIKAIEAVTKLNTVRYFEKLLDEDTETALWRMFITGRAAVRKTEVVDGKPVEKIEIVDIEPNPVSLKAFLKAVEYKRGAPVQIVRDSETEPSKVIEVHVIGATNEYFEKAAKDKGFLLRTIK
jgi:hypothetical protein